MDESSEVHAPPVEVSRAPLIPPPVLTPEETAAYRALRTNAMWCESRVRWSRLHGPQAAEALNGLVTNDVAAMVAGDGLHAAALSPKGKVIADMLVVREDEQTFFVGMLPSANETWLSLARKYINPRLARLTDEGDAYATWMLYGARAPRAIALLGGAGATAENLGDVMISALSEWPVWRHGPWNLGPASVRLIRAPLMGSLPGFLLMASASDAPIIQARLEASASAHGSRNVWNVARIEGGRPAWGVDMDESTLPQEANLDTLGAISFTKGCYTGQETVARIHFRGHVNRHLRGLLGTAPLPAGATVTDASGKVVGDVRSSAVSPRLGPIAIAMIRREVPSGAEVSVEVEGRRVLAQVTELPFSDAD